MNQKGSKEKLFDLNYQERQVCGPVSEGQGQALCQR